jgi:hypothetical protein
MASSFRFSLFSQYTGTAPNTQEEIKKMLQMQHTNEAGCDIFRSGMCAYISNKKGGKGNEEQTNSMSDGGVPSAA